MSKHEKPTAPALRICRNSCVFPIDDSRRVQSLFSMQKLAMEIWDLDQPTVVNPITLKNAQKSMFGTLGSAFRKRIRPL